MLGQSYIGTSTPVSMVSFQVPEIEAEPRGTYGAMRNLADYVVSRRSNLRIAASTGMPDRRYNTTRYFNNDVQSIGRVARIGLVFEAAKLASDINGAIESWHQFWGTDEATLQRGYVESAWQGVTDAINSGFFEPEQITIENLSAVADFLYRGTPIGDENLQGIAFRISEEILHNARPEILQPESGLDGFIREPVIGN